ncbi:MAG: SGNH/GDSL hydrolase family protein [Propionibacteriales bacterium]|nr:SGNH/GDSL hydrolase family protein [Propionibacteriales bacterium]
MSGLFVALGDSFTEGVGDRNVHYPNGVRGWADRVAKHLAKHDKTWRYANLAIRSRRLRHIIDEQVAPALAMRPTLVSLFAGGNDLLDVQTDPRQMLQRYRETVSVIRAGGAQVLMFTSYDLRITPLLEPFRGRNRLFNDGVRAIAAETGSLLVDHQAMTAYEDPRMWSDDRMHMSTAGHKYLAARVLEHLDVPWTFSLEDFEPLDGEGWRRRVSAEKDFWWTYMVPLFGRKIRRVTLGDHLSPKWPVPVRPAKGLRKIERKRRLASSEAIPA